MFGIGKKSVTKKSVFKDKMDSEEIQFDLEEDDKLPFDDDGFADDYAEEEASPGGLRQQLSQRKVFLLVLLLLVALGGGGYYYLNSNPAPPPQPVAVKSKVVVQPAAPATATAPATAPAPAPAPANKVDASAPVAVAPAPVPPPIPVKEQVAPAARIGGAAAVTAPRKATAAARQPFTLSAGAFLGQEYLREAESVIRRLGYTPKVEKVYSMVPMTRLLLGLYDDPAVAQVRSQELSGQVPDLFSLQQGDKIALYAGSYQSLDLARTYADKLYKRGIIVDEETVSLRMALQKITFGDFATRAAAEKAAKRAVAAGLPAEVVKR